MKTIVIRPDITKAEQLERQKNIAKEIIKIVGEKNDSNICTAVNIQTRQHKHSRTN